MEGHLRDHDRPFRGVATPSRWRSDCSMSRFRIVDKAQFMTLSLEEACCVLLVRLPRSLHASFRVVWLVLKHGILHSLYIPRMYFAVPKHFLLEGSLPTLACFFLLLSWNFGKNHKHFQIFKKKASL